MDETGRTRISDLGLACLITPNLRGACGTRGYMAPEMLVRDAHGNPLVYNEAADWFSFGCVLFELRVGCSPFRTPYAKKWMASAVPLNPGAQRPPAGLIAGVGVGAGGDIAAGFAAAAVGSHGGVVLKSSATASGIVSIAKTGGAPIGAALVDSSGNTSGQQTPHAHTFDNHSARNVSRTANGAVTGNATGYGTGNGTNTGNGTGNGGTTRSNNNNNLTGPGGALDPNRTPSRKEVRGHEGGGRNSWLLLLLSLGAFSS